jgi:hypothetical protein
MCPGGRSGGIPSRPLRPSADGRWVGGRPPRVSNPAVAAIQNPEFGQAGRLTYIIIHQVVTS